MMHGMDFDRLERKPKFSQEDICATIEAAQYAASSVMYHIKHSVVPALATVIAAVFIDDVESEEPTFASCIAESVQGFSESLMS